MKKFRSFILIITLLIFNNLVKAEEEIIAGEPVQSYTVVKDQNISLLNDNRIDNLSNHFTESNSKKTNNDFDKIEYRNLEIEGFSNIQVDYSETNESLGDTTTPQSNDLNFDDDKSTVSPDPNMGLLPKNISWMESILWSKNGLFRKIGLTSELTPEQRNKEIGWRRTILTAHQTSGLLTWGLMVAACYTGQKWLEGKSSSPDLHKGFVTATIIGYSLTGLLATIAPPPSIRRDEFSTITVHKTLAWVHVAGMIATPILGKLIKHSNDYYTAARYHQIAAYTTTAIYTTALAVILLFE